MNDGGQAFPRQGSTLPNGEFEWPERGMTLRQWYAGLAMQALYAHERNAINGTVYTSARMKISETAFEIADSMIAESNKP